VSHVALHSSYDRAGQSVDMPARYRAEARKGMPRRSRFDAEGA
jgi:hypothetical protein